MPIVRMLAVVLLLCGSLVAKETKQPLTLEQLEAIAIQPAKKYEETNSRVVPEMLPLFKAEKIVYTGKDRYKETELGFRLHVPEKMESGKKYPLILWLHGVGEAGDDNQDQLVHLHHVITYLTGPKKRDFFLLVPQTPKDHTGWDAYPFYSHDMENRVFGFRVGNARPKITEEPFEDSPLGFSFAMLDQVVKNYPVDPDRITVSGLSSGGDGTWRALERRPEQFAAAVPLVSWNALKDEAITKSPILKKVPIWAIYSSDDRGIEQARTDFARVEAAGCNVKKSEFGICGHNAWSPAMLQADIFSWLLSRGKKGGEYVAVTDANVNPDDMKGIVEVAARVPGGAPKLAPEAPPAPTQPEEIDELARRNPLAEPAVRKELERLRAVRMQAAKIPEPPTAVAKFDRRTLTVKPTTQKNLDGLYVQLVLGYYKAKDTESLKRAFTKLSDAKKIEVLEGILMNEVQIRPQPTAAFLKEIEALIDELQTEPGPVVPVVGDTVPGSPPSDLPGSKIVEDCDREWAMTSESLYGMFPADWDKEGKRIPDFVVKSTVEEFGRALRDPAKLELVCKSILALEHRPMSSPWFVTSGGRLRSDIKYTLSARGKVLREVLKRSDNALAKRTLEKIETLLEQ